MANINIFLVLTFGIYAGISKILFDNVYKTSNLVVDEEFHLPLGEKYCHFNFKHWDPKVTTLPGLYLVTSIILGPFGLCSIYWLRTISFIFSCMNFILLYMLFSSRVEGNWEKACSSLVLNLLPPLHFLSNIYYTDVVSLSSILLFIILNERRCHYYASIAGAISILCRQTNVIFVAIFGGEYVLRELYGFWSKKVKTNSDKPNHIMVKDIKLFITDLLTTPGRVLKKTTIDFWLNASCYIAVLIFFLVFCLLNGGIVVGDKNAHSVSINIPQIFYFSLFCLVFAWPYFLGEVFNFFKFARCNKLLIVGLIAIFGSIVHFNTIVHPYLLADNRHFIFYVWSRFYGKYWWFRYALIPIYIFSLYVIIKTLWNKNDFSFFFMFVVGVSALLISQSLLELRYFLVPYVIIRLKMKNLGKKRIHLCLEFFFYLVVNILTYNIFFKKTLYWSDIPYPQRIIW
ncbi:putative Dol-P-Glc:Glc(2)Man(9)GlcNAc(2)-PP-Dol alpha-1,2-glucosyltransferase [Anthonomus grandis grandis]|uniref:putative Dol-P-Glc:Glc(2)Man(9)GlcNAc(2)-PP-Dol alpha-1,2-glucosyltransferase n=1 Tax=Anthonomus grandis grandis TaxID=2921223 RepID=UPI002165F08E|nr:putative Dol-P-Glc:Glc(2)Man(9)GlcNAc(2)-PP-Dol alpha-1,2-glucosyltransferase [Anthonomus grandis grandis]